MKRALMTGGLGFIGSHLVETLLANGRSVHVVDNLSSNPIPPGQLLDELGHPPALTFDVCSIQDYCMGYPDAEFDEIYHLASPVGPAGILPHAGQMVKQIVDDTYALMGMAQRCGALLLDVSTSEVYGGGAGGLCNEGMARIVPARTTVRLEYAVAKLAAETAIINTCQVSDLRSVIVRPFNVAGPRQSAKGGFVMPRFVGQALRGQALTVFGDGRQVRAFTHVTEIAEGIFLAGQRGRKGEVYNLGNSANRITIYDLAQRVIKVVGQGRIEFVDPKTIYGPLYEEADDKYPDAAKAQRELGWEPQMDIVAIIRDVMRYQNKDVVYAHDAAAN